MAQPRCDTSGSIAAGGRCGSTPSNAGLRADELDGAAVRGLAVHIGARVAAEAEPGDVLVTSTVRDLVVGSGLVFANRGRRSLKGVPREWDTYSASAPDNAGAL